MTSNRFLGPVEDVLRDIVAGVNSVSSIATDVKATTLPHVNNTLTLLQSSTIPKSDAMIDNFNMVATDVRDVVHDIKGVIPKINLAATISIVVLILLSILLLTVIINNILGRSQNNVNRK